jgi:cysteine-rich repeat protein
MDILRRGLVRMRGVALVLLLAGSTAARGANLYEGRDFVLGFPPRDDTDRPTVELQLTSDVGALVTIEYPMGAPTFTRTAFIPPQAAITVDLPSAASQGWGAAGVVERNAVRVYTADPRPARFGVTLVDRARFSSDSALALPADALGTEYVTVMPDVNLSPFGGFNKSGSEFVVVARDPDTTVTIVPTANLVPAYPAFIPIILTLDAGEGFVARTVRQAANGLSGTTVSADHPVVVTNGDLVVRIPPDRPAGDHVFEVALPTKWWGRTIPVFELPARPEGSIYRIIAANDSTHVTFDGAPLTTLDADEFTTVDSASGAHVFGADQPIFVMQFLTGGSTIPGGLGDPAIGNMLPIEQFGRQRSFATVGPGQFSRNWVTVIAESDDAAAGAVTLDGTPIAPAAFTPVPTTAFAAATVEIGPGTHRTESRGVHQVTLVGMDVADSYLHPVAGRRPIDHYLCHKAKAGKMPLGTVSLADAFGTGTVQLTRPEFLCAPADKNGEGVIDAVTHLLAYRATGFDTQRVAVDVTDQFGTLTLNLKSTRGLLVPATKTHPPGPPPLPPDPAMHEVDHYRCVDVGVTRKGPRFTKRVVNVADQFVVGVAKVSKPVRLCVPTDKNGEGIPRPDDALLCYKVTVEPSQTPVAVQTADQFGNLSPLVYPTTELCVPATLARTTCCEPRPTRCRIGGVDAGPCDLPASMQACTKAGGICQSFSCDQLCGNGTVEPWCCEECDDGTRLDGDGCSADCKVQPCCIPQPTRCAQDTRVPCDDSGDCVRAGVGGPCVSYSCQSLCGNGVVDDFCCEPCDDGNGCTLPCHDPPACVPDPCRCVDDHSIACGSSTDCPNNGSCVCYDCQSLCGNGVIDDFCCEQCDGSPTLRGDCSPACREVTCNPQPCRCVDNIEIGCQTDAQCPTGPCVCYSCDSLCGDHVVEPWCCEECDDGTRLDGDGCSATCKRQSCCVPQPLRCSDDMRIPCDDENDCTATGSGDCISVSCEFACGDGLLQSFCCEQCDDGHTCYGYFPEGTAGIPFP